MKYPTRLSDAVHILAFIALYPDCDLTSAKLAESIQTNRDGVPVLLISIPLRYMHTGVETGCVTDIENIGKAVAHMISEIDQENWEGLLCH